NEELAVRNMYDYDDMLLNAYKALQQDDTHQHPRKKYTYILVDEFQDTNELQYEIIKLLNATDNVFVIGDPLQSIYGFRGASAAVFECFKKDWPSSRRIDLIINYRSSAEIVRTANAVFPKAPQLKPYREQPGTVYASEVLNEYSEAEWIVQEIERQVGGSDMLRGSEHHHSDAQRTFKDFAILYRTHAVARTAQRALEDSGIPYQVAGEGSPYLQPHAAAITQSLAYLADMGDVPVVKNYPRVQTKAVLDQLKSHLRHMAPAQLAEKIAKALGLDAERAAASLRQYINSLVRFESVPLPKYVEHMRHIAEQEYYDPMAEAVTLLTIHAAKGLEFSQVFLIGAEQGIIPLSRKGIIADIDEEKRLFYVAVTRARDGLYIVHARTRGGERRQLSEFVTALPEAIVKRRIDPAMTKQVRRIERRRQKHSQGSLF
ncbi:MAG: ATP-dependent helicase, partial [Patescibacteria group bacterium]